MDYLYRPKLKGGARSEIWWAKYYVNGCPVRESAGVTKETTVVRRSQAPRRRPGHRLPVSPGL